MKHILAKYKVFYLPYVLFKTITIIWQSPKSYSQFGEDLELRKFLPEKNGSFLDIGAGRPVIGSNTYNFYRRGWRGISVDPIWLNALLHKIFRPRDKFYLALVGSEYREDTMVYEFFPYEYTTMQPEVAKELAQFGTAKLIRTQKLNCYPPAKIAKSMDPEHPTLICIDAEGSDFSILRAIDFEVARPRVICIESFFGSPETSEIKGFLKKFGYELKSVAGHSLIFVHEKFKPETQRV